MGLKNCPLCGKSAKVSEQLYKWADDSYSKYPVIECENCGLVLYGAEHEDGDKFTCAEIEALIERWNTCVISHKEDE